jgi:molecular chaperone GrpE
MPDEREDPNGSLADSGEEIEIEFVDVDEDEVAAETAKHIPREPLSDEAESTLRAELEHMREMYLRKLAEFDNYRKRTDREREEFRRLAAEGLVRELLPVVDNFERALQHAEEADPETFMNGVEMIASQLAELLRREGLESVDPEGAVFDPELHEAVQRVEDTDHESGTVVSVLSKGYTFGGRLVRPAMVTVAINDAEADRAEQPEPIEDADGKDGS